MPFKDLKIRQQYNQKYYLRTRFKRVAYARKWRKEHPKWVIENNKRYRRKNADKLNQYLIEWRKEHRGYWKRWYAKNKLKRYKWKQKSTYRRRSILYKCKVRDFTSKQWKELLQQYKNKCAYCQQRKATHMEHVIPLCRNGNHTMNNILPACPKCNLHKGSKLLTELGWKDPRKK